MAACICLFSLNKADAIPVDTHVWQLAVRYYAPKLAGERCCAARGLIGGRRTAVGLEHAVAAFPGKLAGGCCTCC